MSIKTKEEIQNMTMAELRAFSREGDPKIPDWLKLLGLAVIITTIGFFLSKMI